MQVTHDFPYENLTNFSDWTLNYPFIKYLFKPYPKSIGRPFLDDLCFPDKIPNVTFDGVLMLLHTIALKTPK